MKTNDSNYLSLNKPDLGSKVSDDALASPVPSNESGQATSDTSTMQRILGCPRLVTRGESYENYEVIGNDGETYALVIQNGRIKQIHIPKPKIDGVASAAIVDFLNCTFPFNSKASLNNFFHDLLPILGSNFAPAISRNSGKYGYSAYFAERDRSFRRIVTVAQREVLRA